MDLIVLSRVQLCIFRCGSVNPDNSCSFFPSIWTLRRFEDSRETFHSFDSYTVISSFFADPSTVPNVLSSFIFVAG